MPSATERAAPARKRARRPTWHWKDAQHPATALERLRYAQRCGQWLVNEMRARGVAAGTSQGQPERGRVGGRSPSRHTHPDISKERAPRTGCEGRFLEGDVLLSGQLHDQFLPHPKVFVACAFCRRPLPTSAPGIPLHISCSPTPWIARCADCAEAADDGCVD